MVALSAGFIMSLCYLIYVCSSLLEFRGKDPEFGEESWVSAPVNKGDLVLIHGRVIYFKAKHIFKNGVNVCVCRTCNPQILHNMFDLRRSIP